MDDILASIRKIIADDFSGGGGLAKRGVDEDAAGVFDDGASDQDGDVLDLGLQSRVVHSLVGGGARQSDGDDGLSGVARRDLTGSMAMRKPNVTTLRGSATNESSDLQAGGSQHDASDRHVRSVAERLTTLRQTSGQDRADPLIGSGEEIAIASAFKSLNDVSRKVAMETKPVIVSPTLETVVLDALKPMLREWLDTHLPGIVENLVRAEIKRLSEPR